MCLPLSPFRRFFWCIRNWDCLMYPARINLDPLFHIFMLSLFPFQMLSASSAMLFRPSRQPATSLLAFPFFLCTPASKSLERVCLCAKLKHTLKLSLRPLEPTGHQRQLWQILPNLRLSLFYLADCFCVFCFSVPKGRGGLSIVCKAPELSHKPQLFFAGEQISLELDVWSQMI